MLAGAGHIGSIPDALTAEAAACAQALQAATNQGISRVQVEVDSTVLQQALQTSSMDLATCGMLLRDTCALLNEHFVCSKIISVPRACNVVAHNLAKLALSWDPDECHVWASPLLEFVMTLFARDVVEPMILIERL